MSSTIEIDFLRLLHRMEEIAGSNEIEDWRFDKYLATLQSMLARLSSKEIVMQPTPDVLKYYKTKVETLSQVWEATHKPRRVEERAQLMLSVPTGGAVPDSAASQRAVADLPFVDGGHTQPGVDRSKSSYVARHKRAIEEAMRKELLGEETSLAKTTAPLSEEEGSGAIRRHQTIHAHLTDTMLDMARQLKSQSAAAGEVIRKDLDTLDKTVKLADANTGRLQKELPKLDAHLKSYCNWTVWIMVVVVFVTFVFMVLLMRLFKKRTAT